MLGSRSVISNPRAKRSSSRLRHTSTRLAECRRPAEDVTKGRLTTRRTKGLATALLFAHMTLAPTAPAALPELLTRTNQPAVVVITNGQVEYLQPLKPPKPAPIH